MNVSKSNLVLLITGTIIPNSFSTLAITDPDIRRKHYIEAINFYLAHTPYKIVFTENSGESLLEYFKDFTSRIEFLTFNSPQSKPDKGKGFKELEIINYAINHSIFIKQSTSIAKITGRLKILNIQTLSKHFTKQERKFRTVFACNVFKEGKMDARCFFFSLDFWTYLNEKGQLVNIKYSIERAMWDSALDYVFLQNGTFKQLKLPLRVEGINAGFGTPYDHSYLTTLLKNMKHQLSVPHYYRKLKVNIK